MTENVEPGAASPLILELLAWISPRSRIYPEAIEAWLSNCRSEDRVAVTALGRAVLDGRPAYASTSG